MHKRKPLIYVVDDNVSICKALTLLLKSRGFEVETFTHARSFLAYKHPNLPSCLILDIRLPDINGLALQDAMAAQKLIIPIIFITGHGDIAMSVRAMRGGAVDFLPKPFTEKKLLNSITQAILKNKIQNKKQAEIAKIKRRVSTLSPRELEVFRLVAKGMMSKNIAFKRGTSLQTIKVHRSRVMQKMRAKTVTELILFGQKVGITASQG
jgi:FixJ family two-component response regulator